MNLDHELDKLTAPAFCASALRSLSRAEIDELRSAGRITDIRDIPFLHQLRRESYPPFLRSGTSYGRSLPVRRSSPR